MKSDEMIKNLSENSKQTYVNEYGVKVTNLMGFIMQTNGEEFTFNVGYEWSLMKEGM